MKKKNNIKVTSFLLILSLFIVSCNKLEKVEGCKVTDFITGQSIEGVRVVANATSDLKSEQRYLHFETMTDKNGKYNIKGLPGKYYSISLIKDGYQIASSGVEIPIEGTKICRSEIELYPNLPNSDSEYNIYNPLTKNIIKKIDHMEKVGYQNNGYGDVHHFYDKYLVEKIEQVNCPQYLLRVGSRTGWCRSNNISKLISLPNKYEIAEINTSSFMIAEITLLYSYKEGSFYKELYSFPIVPKGFYQLGHRLDCSGLDYIVNIK